MTPRLKQAIQEITLTLNSREEKEQLLSVFFNEVRLSAQPPSANPFPEGLRLLPLVECSLESTLNHEQLPKHQRSRGEWAKLLECSEIELEFLLYKACGLRFKEWNRQINLVRAVRLLAEGERVGTVSQAVGYRRPSHFIDAFRRNFGVTPKRFFEVPAFMKPKRARGEREPSGPRSKRSALIQQSHCDADTASPVIETYVGEAGSGTYYGLHDHGEGELLWSPTGALTVGTQRGGWLSSPGEAIWIPGRVGHETQQSDKAHLHCFYLSKVSEEKLKEEQLIRVSPSMGDLLRSMCERDSKVGVRHQESEKWCEALTDMRFSPLPIPLGRNLEPRLNPLATNFRRAPNVHASLETWAELLGLSSRTLSRLVHREYGVSFGKLRESMCVRFAAERLLLGAGVTETAHRLGFKSVSKFGAMFERTAGIIPSQYASTRKARV